VQENSPTSCVKMRAFNTVGKLCKIRCGLWACDYCRRKNAQKWAMVVKYHLENSKSTAYFWTLTLPSRYKTPESAYKDLPRIWDTFRKIIQRYYDGSNWHYCAFVEAHPKRGRIPHFHVISMLPAPSFWRYRTSAKTGKTWKFRTRLKDFAVQAGFGYICDDKPVSTQKAGNYVAKYASKGDDKMPKKFRRCRVSRHWLKAPKFDGPKLIVKAANESVYHYCVRVEEITGISVDELYETWTDHVVT